MHETTKTELYRLKEKLYAELFAVRREVEDLHEQIKQGEKDRKAL
jgi:hypothetical protein